MVGLKSRLSVGSIVWLFVTVFVALAFCSISSVRGAAQSGLPSLFPIFPGRTVDDEPASEYDDGQDLPPIGQLAVEWTAVCHARSSDSQHIEAESEAEYLREYSEQSRTSMQITYSGQCTYLVAGIVGDVFDLENEMGTGTISGGGQREVRIRSVERDLCFRGERFQEVDFAITSQTQTTYQTRPNGSLRPPTVLVYPAAVTISLPRFYTGLDCKAVSKTVAQGADCDGSYTNEDTQSVPYSLILCEEIIDRAVTDPDFSEQLVALRPDDINWTISNTARYDYTSPRDSSSSPNYFMEGYLEISYTVTFSGYSEEPELVIIPPHDYSKWLPEAYEDSEYPGTSLVFEVELRDRNRQRALVMDDLATFEFQLIGTSREPGICLNYPTKEESEDDYDLRFGEQPGYMIISEDGQSARTTKYDRFATVIIDAYDFGAYGRLQVTATTKSGKTLVGYLEGDENQKEITIPLDRNGNSVADYWEQKYEVYGNLPADWDESPNPEGQKHPGDGISLYEKYRGFYVKVPIASFFVHERLDPNWKHLFVFDPDGIVEKIEISPHTRDLRFTKMSRLRLRLIDDEYWTGPGSSADGKRIVNFNSGTGHVTDQHAVHVVAEGAGSHLAFPPGYEDAMTRAGKTAGVAPEPMNGISWTDYQFTIGPPKCTYRVDILPDLVRQDVKTYAKTAVSLAISYGAIDGNGLYARKPPYHWQVPTEGLDDEASDRVRAEAKATRDAWWAEVEQYADRWVEEYIRSHPQDFEIAVLRHTAIVVSHELAHSVGVEHHHHVGGMSPLITSTPGPSEGNLHCVIRIPREHDFGGYERNHGIATDPFYIRYAGLWPRFLCGDPDDPDSIHLLRHAHDVGCWGQVVVSDRYD